MHCVNKKCACNVCYNRRRFVREKRGSVTKATENEQLLDQWNDLEATHARIRGALEQALQREHRLSLTEYEVLRRLSAAPEGHRRIQELADEIHLSQSALSRLVQRLEDEGYASRAVCDHDRRGVYACVTDAGRKAQAEAHPTQVSVLAETLAQPA
jgi:DNA-binding MarR family transcriptional regulator